MKVDTAVEYHSRCIEHLVSVSDDPEAIFDENLLIASIILRFYEEVDAPLSGRRQRNGAPRNPRFHRSTSIIRFSDQSSASRLQGGLPSRSLHGFRPTAYFWNAVEL